MPECMELHKMQQQQALEILWNKPGNKKPFQNERVDTIVLKGFS